MIKALEMYTVICDNCGVDVCKDSEYGGWSDNQYVTDMASDYDWHVDEDKHYCPSCYHFDDDDNIVINSERTKPISHDTTF